MEFRRLRAKSAPPIIRTDDTAAQLRVATNALQFVKRIQGRQKSSSEKADGAAPTNCLSFEETVGRLRTTLRVAQRFKERRRTEADITIHTKPSALLASEMVVRKMSQEELEISLTRTCRPTVSFLARTASNRRINASDIYVPPPYTHVQYFTVDSGRFKGQRPLTQKDKEKLIRRLSTYNPRRRPAESKRIMSNDTKRQLGPLGSYRWNGIRNC